MGCDWCRKERSNFSLGITGADDFLGLAFLGIMLSHLSWHTRFNSNTLHIVLNLSRQRPGLFNGSTKSVPTFFSASLSVSSFRVTPLLRDLGLCLLSSVRRSDGLLDWFARCV